MNGQRHLEHNKHLSSDQLGYLDSCGLLDVVPAIDDGTYDVRQTPDTPWHWRSWGYIVLKESYVEVHTNDRMPMSGWKVDEAWRRFATNTLGREVLILRSADWTVDHEVARLRAAVTCIMERSKAVSRVPNRCGMYNPVLRYVYRDVVSLERRISALTEPDSVQGKLARRGIQRAKAKIKKYARGWGKAEKGHVAE